MTRTTAIGYYHQNLVGLAQRLTDHLATPPEGAPRERLWKVRAKQVVLAQGALEKPLVFDGNDRPGVMLAGAAQTYLHRYGVKVGDRPAIVTAHDSAWHTAFDLAEAGARPAAIVDVRPTVDAALTDRARALGIETLIGWTATETAGRLRVKSLRVNQLRDGRAGLSRTIACDAVLMCGGWTPCLHLFSHTKGSLAWDDELKAFLPGNRTEAVHIAGAGRGLWGIASALADGASAGAQAAIDAGRDAAAQVYTVEADRTGSGVTCKELPTDRNPGSAKAFVDFQNDVTAKDIRLAVREGMRSIEHVKRYTTNGMATDQGKMSNVNGLMIAADALGKAPPQVGLTTFRPPYTPTTFGTLAGYHQNATFEVTRRTPIDPWAEAQGAAFEPVALWRRARYFPQGSEDMHAAVARECRATRASLGIFDASTLGKIEVAGPDAVTFMERMYTNPWAKLGVGRCRYGLLLGEDGFIRDDGVIGRLAADRFHVTTTTGGAARVLNMMEDYLQTEWPDLRVWLTSTTEQWATVALNGPNARKLLEPLVEGLDISAEAFPHMSVAECTVAGFPARLFRISFTGELGFEVNVPARHGLALWERLWAEGQQYDICPYGTETMHVLRAEKGYIIVGQDTDGTLTPDDAGLDLGRRQGQARLRRQALACPPRHAGQGPQAARRPPHRRPEGRARGGRPDRRRSEPAHADDHARPRHLLLLERGARPLDRHGGRRRRPRPRRPDAAHPDAGPDPHGPRRQEHGLLRPRRQAPRRLMESRMNAMTAPSGAGATITELPPATRISLRLADRDAATAALGLDLPSRIGTRAMAGERSALCLGPDEWVIAAPRGRRRRAGGTPRRARGAHPAQRRRGLRPRGHLAARRTGRPRPARHRLPARPRADADRRRHPHRLRYRPGGADPRGRGPLPPHRLALVRPARPRAARPRYRRARRRPLTKGEAPAVQATVARSGRATSRAPRRAPPRPPPRSRAPAWFRSQLR